MDEPDDDRTYRVVVNDEGQYSIWDASRTLPAGWHDAGYTGKREDCLSHINEVWTDMRPKSLRDAMDAQREEAS